MSRISQIVALMVVFTVIATVFGCGSGDASSQADLAQTAAPQPSIGADHGDSHQHSEDCQSHEEDCQAHEHGNVGPHGGHLIELGRNHEYHAELIEDDAREAIAVYILDTHMDPIAISQPSIVLSVTVDKQTTAHELAGVSGDRQTGYSRFESNDKALFLALGHHGQATGKLRVTVEDTPYVGLIMNQCHDHDHSVHRH